MTEPLLSKNASKSSLLCSTTTCSVLGLVVLTGVVALRSFSDGSKGLGHPMVREVSGEIDVSQIAPMGEEWSYYNDVTLKLEKLSPYEIEGKLVQTGYETSFQVSYEEKTLSIARKNTVSGQTEESLYSEKSKALNEEAVVYQFTDKQGTITDGFNAYETYLKSELLLDTYLVSLKLAQAGLTGKSAPVIKGFHNIVQTLAKKADQSKRFTTEMAALAKEINAKIFEEKKKSKHESLLWFEGKNSMLDEKLRYGPCDRYANCTCEIEDRTSSCGNPCFGLCGPDCNCWAWVCGDCDCHCFCYNHDYYCSCVSLFDYHCGSIWLWFDACC